MSVFFGSSNPGDRRWTTRWVGPLPPDPDSPQIPRIQPSAGSNALWKISVEDIISAVSSPPDDWQILPSTTSNTIPLHCGICFDDAHDSAFLQIPECEHAFCHDCLQRYTVMKISQQQYPIKCPSCVAIGGMIKGFVEQETVGKLSMSSKDWENLVELQLSTFAVTLRCPSCKASMRVDRQDYVANTGLSCPLPQCQFRWCRDCRKELDPSETNHRCTNKKLDRLMRRKGWRYCPGCRTPIQKASGCNHMTCESPGCSVHFCYKCGSLIFDSSTGTTISDAVSNHYRYCNQYPGMFQRMFTAIRELNCIY